MSEILRLRPWTIGIAALLNSCSSTGSATTTGDPSSTPADTSTGTDSPTSTNTEALTNVEITDVQVSTGALIVPYANHPTKLTVASLYSGVPFSITVVGTEGGQVQIDGTNVPLNTPYSMTLPKIGTDVDVHITHRDATGALVDETLGTLPADYPTYEVTNNGSVPGRIFLTPYTWNDASLFGYAVILDETGAPSFYARSLQPMLDFKPTTLPNGKLRYSYQLSGKIYVLDENFALLKTLDLLPTERHDALAAEMHEFVLLDDDHWILSAYQTKSVTNVPSNLAGENASPYVIASVLQEVQAGQVVFEWDSTEHPELYGRSSDGNDFANSTADAPADYVHFNCIAIDSNGDWLVSFRHQDAILKIRKSDGETEWTLGGSGDDFSLTSEQRFSHQHSIHILDDGKLLFFDNGNATQATRIVEMGLDIDAKQVTSFSNLPGNRFSMAMGYVERQDDRYFIGWGAHTAAGSDVTEVDATTGAEYFSLRFLEDRYSYRAIKR